MAEKEKKEKSPQEQLREDDLNNLKSLAPFVASNLLRGEENPFGQIGSQTGKLEYMKFSGSDRAKEIRDAVYQSKMKEAAELGLADMPEYTSNYELSKNAMAFVRGAQTRRNLGDLLSVSKEFAPGLTLTIPDKLKGISMEGIMLKQKAAAEKGEEYKPSKEEQDASAYHKLLSEAFNRGSAYIAIGSNYLSDINEMGNQLSEKYKPKDTKKSDN